MNVMGWLISCRDIFLGRLLYSVEKLTQTVYLNFEKSKQQQQQQQQQQNTTA